MDCDECHHSNIRLMSWLLSSSRNEPCTGVPPGLALALPACACLCVSSFLAPPRRRFAGCSLRATAAAWVTGMWRRPRATPSAPCVAVESRYQHGGGHRTDASSTRRVAPGAAGACRRCLLLWEGARLPGTHMSSTQVCSAESGAGLFGRHQTNPLAIRRACVTWVGATGRERQVPH